MTIRRIVAGVDEPELLARAVEQLLRGLGVNSRDARKLAKKAPTV